MSNKKRKKKKNNRFSPMLIISLLVLTVLLGCAVRLFVLEPMRVNGNSMEPSLSTGDVVLVNKLRMRVGGGLDRGDVVMLSFDSRSGTFVKRIAGVPGDEVEVNETGVFINGEKAADGTEEASKLKSGTIPDGYYLVLGDNRLNSNDSRLMGLVSENNIQGKCAFSVWPLAKLFRGL